MTQPNKFNKLTVDCRLLTLDHLTRKLRPDIRSSALNTVWRKVDKTSEIILDVGCGKGEPMAFINRQGSFKVVGIDIFKPYLGEARRKGVYQDLILGDVRHLSFKDKSFDAIICTEVLVHLEKGKVKEHYIGEESHRN